MTLYEKSLNVLELPAVLKLLSAEAVSEPAKAAALELQPSDDAETVRDRLAETSAAYKMMTLQGAPAFSWVKDVSMSLRRAAMGGMLNTRELLDIAGVLRTSREVRAYAAEEKAGRTCIDNLFHSLRANKYLEEKIYTSITAEDEISDAASPTLADIRRHMRIAGDKVRQSLQKIIASPYYQKALQEPIITMRNDRYVVPVKAEHKAAVPGLVHDISSSGATLFIEPMSAVQANNEIRELLAREKNEIDRILMALSAEAADYEGDINCDFGILVRLDIIFAKAKLSFAMNGCEPEIDDGRQLVLRRARHPLLPKGSAVPVDITLGGEYDTLIVTGPNTGGKTVSLKTTGLLCVMAMCGLHIPASDGSRVPIFEKVLADIGDEQSIEQSLSTFSAHMTNIVKILGECGDRTLLLFDELGAGTDPVEGAALAISIIEYARKTGAVVAATTHYSELKVYATTQPGVQNASCEFDVETLRPTYRLLIGVPGKSNAFAISRRLGLSDVIIDDAKSRMDENSASFEDVLGELEKKRQQMEKADEELRLKLARARDEAAAAEENRRRTDAEREKAAKLARREANKIIEEARREADEVFEELGRLRRDAAKDMDWQRINDARAGMRRKLNEAENMLGAKAEEKAPLPPTRPAVVGDTVEVLSLGAKAEVVSVSPAGVLTLQAGMMKVTAKQDEVRVVSEEKPKTKERSSAVIQRSIVAVSPEIDIRGMMTDEALPIVERYIDSAQMAKLTTVTIIHGKGTGALRQAVRTALRKNRQVKSFRPGIFGEGEDGVTVVTIK